MFTELNQRQHDVVQALKQLAGYINREGKKMNSLKHKSTEYYIQFRRKVKYNYIESVFYSGLARQL